MPKKWAEVIASPEYQGLSAPEKANAQAQYFDQVVKPQLPADQVDEAHSQFYNQYPVSNTTPQPTEPTPAPTEQGNMLERGFNAFGEVAAGVGRQIAGIPVSVSNAVIGTVNTIGEGSQRLSNQITGETGVYQPIPKAGYGSLDKYLAPRGVEQIGSDIGATLLTAPLTGAEMAAAKGAPLLTRAAAAIGRNAGAAIVPTMAEHTSGKDSDEALSDFILNTAAGVGGEIGINGLIKVGKSLIPRSMAERAATAAPDYAEAVYQGGDEAAQQAFRTATTDEAGNVILNPSQTMNPETRAGRRYIREEQRSRATGTASPYEQNVRQQASGQSFERAVNEADTGADLQATSDTLATNFKTRANELYAESKRGAQQILDDAKISQLKMPQSKQIATTHLEDNAATGNIKLNSDARRTLKQFADPKNRIKTIDDLGMWKRTLYEKAQKAKRGGDMQSHNALMDLRTSLINEGDQVLTSINPQAASFTRDADKFYSQSVGDFGPNSLIGKIANTENPVKANNVFLGANSLQGRAQGALNTNELTQILDSGVARGDVTPELAQQMRESLGNASRSQAFDYAATNAQFNPSTFANRLHQYRPQAEATGATNVNNALRQAAELTETRATAGADFADNVGDLAARGVFTVAGGLKAGPAGAMAGNFVGGKVADLVPRLIDRATNTAGKSKAMIDFVSQPENAKKVLDIIEASGHSLDSIPDADLTRIIKLSTRFGVQSATQQENKEQSALPTLTQPTPAPAQEFNVTAPEPEQHAQAAKAPKPVPENDLATHLYRSLSVAETGGLDNRFIRTKAAEAGLSTAYGPAQLTVTTAKNFYDKHPDLFNDEQKAYMQRFIEQGQRMKEAPKDDEVFGYGKPGTMGNSAEDRRTYYEVNRIMLDQMIKKNNGDLEKTLREWRYGDPNADIDKRDPGYARKVRQAWSRFNEPAAPKPASNKAWKGAA
ncbi:hypothetical protein K0N88_001196 [Salmonella enterica]|nr:hypothetical protein [Salmonella enterica]